MPVQAVKTQIKTALFDTLLDNLTDFFKFLNKHSIKKFQFKYCFYPKHSDRQISGKGTRSKEFNPRGSKFFPLKILE